ncbi:MAG: protease modulator HflC [Alphaproteobacteria bacterium]|nr:protease modulator HflC [Alphaproteobacteria bacterium]
MNRTTWTVLAVIVVALGVVGFSSTFTVHQTEQALVLQFGDPKRVVTEPGLNLKLPFVQNVVSFDNRILGLDAPAEEIIASDQKRLVVDAFMRYRIVDPLGFYKAVGSDEVARARLTGVLISNLRRVLGSVPLANLLSGERGTLMLRIRDLVNGEAKQFGMAAVDVRIKRADLPEANNQAIYGRMNTERDREAREFRAQGAEISQRIKSRADREKTVLLAEARKRAQILRGEGDATRNHIFAEAYNRDPEFFAFYRSMQAYTEALGGKDTTIVLSPEGEFFRFFRGTGAVGGAAALP